MRFVQHKSGTGPIEQIAEEHDRMMTTTSDYWIVQRNKRFVMLPKEDYALVAEATAWPVNVTKEVSIGPNGETLLLNKLIGLSGTSGDVLIIEKLP